MKNKNKFIVALILIILLLVVLTVRNIIQTKRINEVNQSYLKIAHAKEEELLKQLQNNSEVTVNKSLYSQVHKEELKNTELLGQQSKQQSKQQNKQQSKQIEESKQQVVQLKEQLEILERQLRTYKRNVQTNSSLQKIVRVHLLDLDSGNANVVIDKTKPLVDTNKYVEQIDALKQSLEEANRALNLALQAGDNIKFQITRIQATGIYLDGHINIEKETMYAKKMGNFRISFNVLSKIPLNGDLTLFIKIYALDDDDKVQPLLLFPGTEKVDVIKKDGSHLEVSYAQTQTVENARKIFYSKVFDASVFSNLTQNAIYILEIYNSIGTFITSTQFKVFAGKPVTTW